MSREILILEQFADTYAQALRAAFPDIVFHAAVSTEDALRTCGAAEVIIALAHEVSDELVGAMPHLRWVSALTTGTDHLDALTSLPRDVIITSGRGIHGPQVSEMAFLYMIALSRDFRRMQAKQAAHVWERWPQRLLLRKTAVIVGVGTISEELATRCKAFGMSTIGVSSARAEGRGFDEIVPRAALKDVAAQADYLIVLVPYARETHHMINADILSAMPPTAILVNLARGGVIDEAAMIETLSARRIAGAGLDVFAVEPLPAESPLWDLDNVIVTPRVGGMSDIYAEQIMPLLIENIGHYVNGRPLRNVVRRGA